MVTDATESRNHGIDESDIDQEEEGHIRVENQDDEQEPGEAGSSVRLDGRVHVSHLQFLRYLLARRNKSKV